eukprot:TRINITY_DN27723_c0_g1_i1.p1 TRINITY_DN27723_c0_g1~~TRINITY_DN27723_c0_g1_i1.p1  ORF type:complete len:439 (+),score=29.86 TRINITY_DN27723_c0_g1_i1:63-1379(+)
MATAAGASRALQRLRWHGPATAALLGLPYGFREHGSMVRTDEGGGDVMVDCAACTRTARRVFCGGEHTLLRDPLTLGVYQLGACGLGFDHDNAAAYSADSRAYIRNLNLPGPASGVFPGCYHNLFRLNGGKCVAYGCGRQAPNDGQLLTGSVVENTQPLPTCMRFAEAAAGGHHSLCRTRAGEVWACGAGWQAQMGNGGLQPKNHVPLRIEGLPKVRKLATGYYHIFALSEDGQCFAWGCNEQGQLGGVADQLQVLSPQLLADLLPDLPSAQVQDVDGGYGHSVLLLGDGSVLTLGNHSEGQRCLDPDLDDVPRWNKVEGLSGPAQAIAAGNHHTLVLVNGIVYAFGSDEYGQVSGAGAPADGDADVQIWHPTIVKGLPSDDPVLMVSAGMYHSAAQTESGRIFIWGCGSNGQTGDTSLPSSSPLTEIRLADISHLCS